jgi:hypothetical protein
MKGKRFIFTTEASREALQRGKQQAYRLSGQEASKSKQDTSSKSQRSEKAKA